MALSGCLWNSSCWAHGRACIAPQPLSPSEVILVKLNAAPTQHPSFFVMLRTHQRAVTESMKYKTLVTWPHSDFWTFNARSLLAMIASSSKLFNLGYHILHQLRMDAHQLAAEHAVRPLGLDMRNTKYSCVGDTHSCADSIARLTSISSSLTRRETRPSSLPVDAIRSFPLPHQDLHGQTLEKDPTDIAPISTLYRLE
jgi:hypothetical protein